MKLVVVDLWDSLARALTAFSVRPRWLALLFFLLTLATGIRLALLTPIGQVADEPAHVARAAALMHGELLGHRVMFAPPGKAPVKVPATRVNYGLLNASIDEMGATCANRTPIAQAAAWKWTRTGIIDIDYNTIQYFPALYLPGTLGIAVGKLIGQRPLGALFTGRIFMLLAYCAFGVVAIGVARFGRGLLFAVLSLPMALSLGASFNQDGLLIAVSALTGALLTLPQGHRGRWWALPLFTLVICSKPPYGLLLFACLLPLARGRIGRRTLGIALWAIPPLIWVAVMTRVSLMPYLLAPYHPGPLWPGGKSDLFTTTDPLAALLVLLRAPARFVTLPAEFLAQNAAFLLRSGIGELGWLSIPLAPWLYAGWSAALLVAAVGMMAQRADRPAPAWDWRDSLLVLALVVVSVFAVELAIYLSWDRVGDAAITGPQGRYYLLFIPFLMLAVPRFPVRWAAWAEAATALPAVALAAYDVIYLPGLMLRRFCLG